jgi:hypothetical protein
MVEIPLTRGLKALVDDVDGRLAGFWWYANPRSDGLFYARRDEHHGPKKKAIYLHREVLGVGVGLEVDHKNGDTLDCRRENLRPATHQQNSRNVGTKRSFKGVDFKQNDRRKNKPWQARIKIDGRTKFLGYYETPEDAARAYDEAAVVAFGDFAKLNFPRE